MRDAPAARLGRALLRRLGAGLWPGPSGPAAAWLFHRAFAAISFAAWVSLGWQIRLLVGERGLLPIRPLAEDLARRGDVPLLAFPSLFRLPALATDGWLVAGTVLGAALSALAFVRIRPRLCFLLSTALYLSYAAACRGFLAFQWDNLLLEVGLLAAFLPDDRPAPLVHLLLRLVAFKLYFESGIAKWQSDIKDWHDGSAMAFYYETAPLPTFIAWYAHNLPAWWHVLESRATLVLELGVPFLIFGPRRARLLAFTALTVFQIIDVATANYGFFCYLAAVLHILLLDDRDLLPLRRHFFPSSSSSSSPSPTLPLRLLPPAAAATWIALSLLEALAAFSRPGPWLETLGPVRRLHRPLRVVNTYHLFASITRDRIEPEIQTLEGGVWRPQHFWHKPGDPARPPDIVAPHQPRVDFLLWFYGLRHDRADPAWVSTILHGLCRDPDAVQPLFRARLPASPQAVRIAFARYTFTTPAERRATGRWWRVTPIGLEPSEGSRPPATGPAGPSPSAPTRDDVSPPVSCDR